MPLKRTYSPSSNERDHSARCRRAPLLRDFREQLFASVDANLLLATRTKSSCLQGAKLLDATLLRERKRDRITKSIVAAVNFPHPG